MRMVVAMLILIGLRKVVVIITYLGEWPVGREESMEGPGEALEQGTEGEERLLL